MSRFSGLIFDMDGVLIQSSAAHRIAFLRILSRFEIWSLDYSTIAGMRTDDAFRQIFRQVDRVMTPEEIERLVAEKRAVAREEILRTSPLTAGCKEWLTAFRLRMKLGLATSSSLEQMNLFLKLSESAELFDAKVCGDEVKRAKPFPDIFKLCAERLKIPPAGCLVVEDSRVGVEAALAGGFWVLIMGSDFVAPVGTPRVLGNISELREIEGYL